MAKVNYQNTIMYLIVSKDNSNDNCYIGQTTHFYKRKSRHKHCCNNPLSTSYNYKIYKTIRENGGFHNWEMIELEKYPCNNVTECRARERWWFNKLKPTLNSNTPNRTHKEYLKMNREKIYGKLKESNVCECGSHYAYRNKARHLKSPKHQKYCQKIISDNVNETTQVEEAFSL